MMKLVEVEADHLLLLLLKQTHANKEVEITTLIFTTKQSMFPTPKIPHFFWKAG